MSVKLDVKNPKDIVVPKKILGQASLFGQIALGNILSEFLRPLTAKIQTNPYVDDLLHFGIGSIAATMKNEIVKNIGAGIGISGISSAVRKLVSKYIMPLSAPKTPSLGGSGKNAGMMSVPQYSNPYAF